MANEFPQLSDVFALDKQVTYTEAVEQVWLPQDNAILSVPSASPIETLTLSGYKITPTVALGAITYASGTTAELHFIDYSNLRDGAIIQIRILDNTYPITIKNGITGNGGIFTSNGEDILLSDYRKIVQLQREGSIWRQVGTIQSANLPITNCLTEIPQDIKLELNEGTLTLKAGSKVYVPNGFEDDGVTPKFDVVVVAYDVNATHSANVGLSYVYYRIDDGTIVFSLPQDTYSGTEVPVVPEGDTVVMYNSATNKVNWILNNVIQDTRSLPLALVQRTGSISSIDQVFNGFGYIDSTVYALPGVKGLIPNGRNEDGSLKNIEFTVDRVRPQTFTSADNFPEVTYWLTSTGEFGGANVNINYHSNINKVLYDVDGTSRAYCNAGGFAVVRGKITSLTPKLPFRAVDYNDMHIKQDEATAVNYDNITNCITEIPQDIKVEINSDGKAVVKAGSKCYFPNGAEKFDVYTVPFDLLYNFPQGQTGVYFLAVASTGGAGWATVSVAASGTLTAATTSFYYRTDENKIWYLNDASATVIYSFPLAIVDVVNGVGTIKQVFNGFGYIGSTVFALPGVKGLIPNGRNADGSLKNIEVTLDSVVIETATTAASLHNMLLTSDNIYFDDAIYAPNWQFVYKEEENIIINTGNNLTLKGVLFGKCITDSNGVITSFTPKLPFHAVDYNDAALKQNFQVVSTLPSSPQPDVFYFIPE